MGGIKHYCTVVVAGVSAAAAVAASAEVSVTIDFASAYAFRGSHSDTYVIQPGFEISGFGMPEKYGCVLVGMWGNFALDDNNGTVESSEFSEIDLYAYYSLPTIVDGMELYVGYTEYIFPNEESGAYKEANVGMGYEVAGLALEATAYLGIGGGINGDAYYNLSAYYTREIVQSMEVWGGTQVGYYDPNAAAAGWNDGLLDLGITYSLNEVWYVGASVASVVLLNTDEEVLDTIEMIGMLSLGAHF